MVETEKHYYAIQKLCPNHLKVIGYNPHKCIKTCWHLWRNWIIHFFLILTWVVYMCSSWLQLASGSRDLSHVEKSIPVTKSWANSQIHKITTIVTKNDNYVHPGQFCEFTHLYITIIYFSAWGKSRNPRDNWSKLEDM